MTCLEFEEAVVTSQSDWIEREFAAYISEQPVCIHDDAGLGLSRSDLESLNGFRRFLVPAEWISLTECKRIADMALVKAGVKPQGLIQQIVQSFRLAGQFKHQWKVEEQEPGTVPETLRNADLSLGCYKPVTTRTLRDGYNGPRPRHLKLCVLSAILSRR